jgi:acetyl-CoA synthetase
MTDDILWRPTAEFAARTRLGRFMAKHGIDSLAALQRRSVEDPEWYWDAVSKDLGIVWTKPYRRVLDTSRGIQWPRWFEGGEMNLAANCVDRHLAGPRRDAPAIIWEGDDGSVRSLTFAELAREVNRLAGALSALGVGSGDSVGIFLPMSPEAAIATLAVVRIGAIYTPCFSGYGAQAVASRLQDCEAKVLITADGFQRRGQKIAMKRTADEAVAMSPSIRHVIVHRRAGGDVPWTAGRDRWWDEAVAGQPDEAPALPVDADRPCLIIYTSGTTGRPKGTVLTHGGFGIKAAHDWAYVMDVGEGDRVFWLTDLGWLMGPMLITGTLLHGGTVVLFEGTPDYPQPDRLWALCERHGVTHLGISPPRCVPSCHTAPNGSISMTCRPYALLAPQASRGIRSRTCGSSSTPGVGRCRSSTTQVVRRSRAAFWAASPLPRSSPVRFTVPSLAWLPTVLTTRAALCAAR